MLKKILLLVFVLSCNSTFAQTNPVDLLQSIFKAEGQPLNTDLDEIDISLSAAATIRALCNKGYWVGVQVGGTLKSIEFKDLEKQNFNVPGSLMILEEDGISLKASVRLYLNATDEGKPVSEAASVYVFIYANKSNGKIYIKRVDVDFKGLS
ncbi:hypothetical protein K2X05_10765 [bacterium]|nr:hypothetical protein [bacterium]